MKSYQYLVFSHPSMSDGLNIECSSNKVLEWVEEYITRVVPDARFDKLRANLLPYIGVSNLHDKGDEISRDVFCRLLETGWEPFQVEMIKNSTFYHLRLETNS